jgi:HAD superfamily hydrolase (TIGR01484 family)
MANRYRALATDFDGTIAKDGLVSESTLIALERARSEGYRLILVTGRELDELLRVFPALARFDIVVAENGALLYSPLDGREEVIGDRPPSRFVEELATRGVKPLSRGRVVVATRVPNETTVLAAIRDLGLELQVIFNKGAVMVLPTGTNKAVGLKAALRRLGIQPLEVIGFGDAENDHAFLDLCGYSVAVANALPAIKRGATYVAAQAHGEGVVEFLDRLLAGNGVPAGGARP